MTKEEIFLLLQYLILELRDNKQLPLDARLMQDWVAKQTHLTSSISSLNTEDNVWLDTNYRLWFEKEIKPHIGHIGH